MNDSPTPERSEKESPDVPEAEEIKPLSSIDRTLLPGAVNTSENQQLGIHNYSTSDAIQFLATQRLGGVAVKTALQMAAIFIEQQRRQSEIIKTLSVKTAEQECQLDADKKHKPLFKVIEILAPVIAMLGIESIANDRGNIGIVLIIIALALYLTSILVGGKK